MKTLTIYSDKIAIGLSFLCLLHCLTMPLLIAFLPSLAAVPLAKEAFHLWMVIAVIPISIYALTLGCKRHKTPSVAITGLCGLTLLIGAVLVGENLLGENGEKLLTVFGAILIALSHYQNYSRCQRLELCPCPSSRKSNKIE